MCVIEVCIDKMCFLLWQEAFEVQEDYYIYIRQLSNECNERIYFQNGSNKIQDGRPTMHILEFCEIQYN